MISSGEKSQSRFMKFRQGGNEISGIFAALMKASYSRKKRKEEPPHRGRRVKSAQRGSGVHPYYWEADFSVAKALEFDGVRGFSWL